MSINAKLYSEIKEHIHLGCESDTESTSDRAFKLLAIFDALEGVSDGSQSAEDLVRDLIDDEPADEEMAMVECVDCGEQVADPGRGVTCEFDAEDGKRCGGMLEPVAS